MNLSNTEVLTTEMIVEYATVNPSLSYFALSKKIVKEGGLYQYANEDSLRRNVTKKLNRLSFTRENKPVRRLFFDIETSPNIGMFWRSGYKLNIGPENIIKERGIICICYKWEGEDKVHHLTWDKMQCDKEMLIEFAKVLKQSDEVVGHNGDRFDLKWFHTRCLFHRIPVLPKYKSLDTLKKAKSHFNFNSNKLDYIAKFLGVGGKISTGGFQLWKDILLHQCDDAMDKMVEYCANDVIILEDVYHTMKSYITGNTNHATFKGGNAWDCPTCTSINVEFVKNETTIRGTIQRWMECKDCKTNHKISNSVYNKYVEYKYSHKEE